MTTTAATSSNDVFLHPLPLSETKQKILSIEENKIKILENRLSGPNSEGKPPFEFEPLKESELENIKTKIILQNENLTHEEKEKNSASSSNSKKKTNNNKNLFDYLMTKRTRENSNHIKEIKTNSQLSNTEEKNNVYNNSNSNSYQDVFSSKHCSLNNNLFTKNKNISDYYTKTDTKQKNKKENNCSNTAPKSENSSNDNNVSLLTEIKEKNKLLLEKDKELEKLKLLIKESTDNINELTEYNKSFEMEIKRCRYDICALVKENENYKRQIKKREIHEKQYKIGKIGLQRFSHGQLLDYWEDGEELIYVKRKLDEIKNEKEEIEKMRRRLSNSKSRLKNSNNNSNTNNNINNDLINIEHDVDDQRDLLMFKWNNILREETEMKEKKERLELEKQILIHDINLFNQETKCTLAQKRDGWPLLAGRYQITGLLGKGGYSEVYKAYDLENHNIVACKLHQLNPSWKEEIKDNYIKHTIRENQIHKEISHSKIVKHYDTIEIDNNSFVTVLEYCTGPDLAGYLQRNRNIGEKEARIIITQILLGLEYLNKLPNKIIHYDLKPENIIFHNSEVKISDFGLAKIIENNKDKIQLTSQGVGTYWYLPPECFEENTNVDISSKVDIWSCGVILYEIFFRKKPFGQNYSQDTLLKEKIMFNAKKVEFPPKPIISEECKDFIKRCLAFRQEDRYDVFQALNSPFIRQEKSKKEK